MAGRNETSESASTPSAHVGDSPRRQLRALIERDEVILLPGIHDPFSARAAQDVGFEAVYLGAGVSVAVGYHVVPDMTIVSTRDVIELARGITRAIDIPLIVDFDDGGGNPLQVRHSVQLAEAAGIAGFHIEDSDFAYPKHMPPKEAGRIMQFEPHLLSREAAVARVRAAVEARRDPDLVIIARTDGALISKEESLTRMKMLADAGADMILPVHFPFEDVGEAVEASGVPVMMVPIRVGSPTAAELDHARQAGVRMVQDVTSVPYAMYRAAMDTLRQLKETGVVETDHSETMKFVQERIRWPEWGDLAVRYRA